MKTSAELWKLTTESIAARHAAEELTVDQNELDQILLRMEADARNGFLSHVHKIGKNEPITKYQAIARILSREGYHAVVSCYPMVPRNEQQLKIWWTPGISG